MAEIDEFGVVALARQVVSPNFDQRPASINISLVVVHGISLPPSEFRGDEIEKFFCNALDHSSHPYYIDLLGIRVSAHFLVRRDGAVVQFVPCANRAWHAGLSSWRGIEKCNDFSIGIELEGADDIPYAAAQYFSLATLIELVKVRYPIRDIVGHSDVAPDRKSDPGPMLYWAAVRSMAGD
jgi:AmpD protein